MGKKYHPKKPGVPHHLKKSGGDSVAYFTLDKAKRYLRLQQREFQKLAIVKGVYPREPKSRIKVKVPQRLKNQVLYMKKDIRHLAADPIIWDLYAYRTLKNKISKAKGQRDFEKSLELQKNRLNLDLRHVILQRYPRFRDALADLDDPLSTMFLYAQIPKNKWLHPVKVETAQRLIAEFQHYVIEIRALRKTFISFKGYYYTVQLKGVDITWIVPHQFVLPSKDSDEYAMSIFEDFLDFYIAMIKFINYRLFTQLNYNYPLRPAKSINFGKKKGVKLALREEHIWLASLNASLSSQMVGPNEIPPPFYKLPPNQYSCKKGEPAQKCQTVFENLKIFISRECSKDSLTFVIRSGGGQVSWDPLYKYGSTFQESDSSITHHICDRPQVDNQKLSRYYVQPQWVYDSFNVGICLPVSDYFIGVTLPPHLSPYEKEEAAQREVVEGDKMVYKPPEQVKEEALLKKIMIEDPNKGVDSDTDSEFDPHEHENEPDTHFDLASLLKKAGSIDDGEDTDKDEPISKDDEERESEQGSEDEDNMETLMKQYNKDMAFEESNYASEEDGSMEEKVSEDEGSMEEKEDTDTKRKESEQDVLAGMEVTKVTQVYQPNKSRYRSRQDHKDLTYMTIPKKHRFSYKRLLKNENLKMKAVKRQHKSRMLFEENKKKLQDEQKVQLLKQKQKELDMKIRENMKHKKKMGGFTVMT